MKIRLCIIATILIVSILSIPTAYHHIIETTPKISENDSGIASVQISTNETIFNSFGIIEQNNTENQFKIQHNEWTSNDISIYFANITGQQDSKLIQREETAEYTKFFRTTDQLNPNKGYWMQQEYGQEIYFDRNVHLYSAEMQFQFVSSLTNANNAQKVADTTHFELRTDNGDDQPHKTTSLISKPLNESWVINKNQSFDSYCDYPNTFTTLLLNTTFDTPITSDTSYWIVFNSTGDRFSTPDYTNFGFWTYYNPDSLFKTTNRSLDTIQINGNASPGWVLTGWTTDWVQNANYHPYLNIYYRITDMLTPEEIAMNITSPQHSVVSNSNKQSATLYNINTADQTTIMTEANESVMYTPSANGTLYKVSSPSLSGQYAIHENYANWIMTAPLQTIPITAERQDLVFTFPSEFYDVELINETGYDAVMKNGNTITLLGVDNASTHFIFVANSSNRVAFINIADRVQRGSNSLMVSGVGAAMVNISIFNTKNELIHTELKSFGSTAYFSTANNDLGVFTINASYIDGYYTGFKTQTFEVYDTTNAIITLNDTTPFGTHRNIPNTQLIISNGSEVYFATTNGLGQVSFPNIEYNKWWHINWNQNNQAHSETLMWVDGQSSKTITSLYPYYFTTSVQIQVKNVLNNIQPCNITVNNTNYVSNGITNINLKEDRYNISVWIGETLYNSSIFEVWTENSSIITIYTEFMPPSEENTGHLSVRIRDSLGRYIPNLAVHIRNATTFSDDILTDEDGFANYLDCWYGEYELSWLQNEVLHTYNVTIPIDTPPVIITSGDMWYFTIPSIAFIIKDSTWDEYSFRNLGFECTTILNGTSQPTNENGEVIFSNILEGEYNLTITKTAQIYAQNLTIRQENSTSIIIITQYDAHPFLHQKEVNIIIRDVLGRVLPHIEITLNNSEYEYKCTTDEYGRLILQKVEISIYNLSWIQEGTMQRFVMTVPLIEPIFIVNATIMYYFNTTVTISVKDTSYDTHGDQIHQGYRANIHINGEVIETNDNGEAQINLREGNYTLYIYYGDELVYNTTINVLRDISETFEIITSIDAHPIVIQWQMPIWGWILIGITLSMFSGSIFWYRKVHPKFQVRDEIAMANKREIYNTFQDELNIQCIIVIHRESGSLLQSKIYQKENFSDDLFAGFLTGLQGFESEYMKDASKRKGLERMQYGSFNAYIFNGVHVTIAVFLERELQSKTMRQRIESLIKYIETTSIRSLTPFSGDLMPFKYLRTEVGIQLQTDHQYALTLTNAALKGRMSKQLKSYLLSLIPSGNRFYLAPFISGVTHDKIQPSELDSWVLARQLFDMKWMQVIR